ncbi:hypothetical protein KGM_211449 [Danaus plexippus plexippus]|uniref:Uncharacterized protein n=1 Tax=Danaus plexippus plexippus TaxID=278856 RepID=A0A212EQ21_DANPL|nr:hypothetical protein KGM_211449 [Danaus plexippus plexippus]
MASYRAHRVTCPPPHPAARNPEPRGPIPSHLTSRTLLAFYGTYSTKKTSDKTMTRSNVVHQ